MHTPFLLLYDYDLESKSENFWKDGSQIATGKVYTHSVNTVPVTIWLWFWVENWKFWKYGSYVKMGKEYSHSVYTVPVTIWLWFWVANKKIF